MTIKDKERLREYSKERTRQWRIRHPNNYQENKERYQAWTKQYRILNKERLIQSKRQYYESCREKAYNILGGRKCTMCGFDDIRVLQLDHINGGGRDDMKNNGMIGIKLYNWIIKNPELAIQKYQVLCANHNWIKRYDKNEIIRKI